MGKGNLHPEKELTEMQSIKPCNEPTGSDTFIKKTQRPISTFQTKRQSVSADSFAPQGNGTMSA